MASAHDIQQQVFLEKIQYAANIRQFEAKNWDRMVPSDRIEMPSKSEVSVYVFENGEFRVSDDKVYKDKHLVIELFNLLKPYIGSFHPEFFQGYDNLVFRDHQVISVMKLEQLLISLENLGDSLPNLKHELIELGKALERGQTLKSYLSARRNSWVI